MFLLSVIPILTYPIIQENLESYFQKWNPLFLFFKIYSLSLFTGLFFLWKKYPQFKEKLFARLIYIFLAVNILEATVIDFLTDNYINGLSGIILIMTSPSEATYKITSYDDGKSQHIEGGFTTQWILFYTAWNFMFTYNQFSTFGNHIILLLTPLLVAFFYGKERWLECRVVSLFVWISLRLILTVESRPLCIELGGWGNYYISLYGALFALTLGLITVYLKFRKQE